MNNKNLHELIDRYEQNFEFVNNSEHDEIFKWRAVKQFRDSWFASDAKNKPFSEMFNEARKGSAVLIDNSQVSPTNGIVKLAEVEPVEVPRLFNEILFADDGGDITKRQNNMEKFLEKIEKLRLKHFPQFWKYKQDRHAVSCYMVFFAPEQNFIYRYSDAETFAQYIEFGIDIGSGENFKLDAYYKMCDMIVEALKEHPSLLEKHFTFLSDECYRDESLHLLAFDLMYCARCYNFYNGLTHASKKESVKAYTEAQLREKEQREKEEKINALLSEIHELKLKAETYADISLLNVQVTQKMYGTGIIIKQEANKVTVLFGDIEKVFIINKQFAARPTFEDDEEIVEAFTEYDIICRKIASLESELKRL